MNMKKILSWVPIVGFFVELFGLFGGGNYLSDVKHPARYIFSIIYHALFFTMPIFWLI